MTRLLRQRNFVLFFTAGSVSLLGDWALVLALPYYVYGQTESIASTAGLVAAELLPRLLFSSAAGVLADRWNRRLTLIGVDLFRAGLVLAILIPAMGGPLWTIYVVAVLEASASQLFLASEGALLPTIVRKDDLMAANSLVSTGISLTRLVGPPLGGLVFVVLGLGTSAVIDSASFLVSGLAFLAIRQVVPAPAEEVQEAAGPGFLRELVDGFRFVKANRVFEALCLILGVVMVAQGLLQTLLVPFLRDVLGFDAVQYGFLSAAQGLGSLAGAFGVGAVARYLTHGRVVGIGLFVAAAATLGFAMARPLVLSAAFLFLLTVPVVVASVWVQTYYQQHVHNRLLGRVLGLTENVSAMGILAGVVTAALLGGALGSVALMVAAAGVLLVGGVLASIALRKATTALDARAEPELAAAAEVRSG